MMYTEQDMLSMYADDVALEWEEAGKRVAWPEGMTYEEAYDEADYPADVWAEGQARWEALSEAEQQAAMADAETTAIGALEMYKSEARQEVFLQSFSLFDLLWIGLAVFTAFKLGAGASSE